MYILCINRLNMGFFDIRSYFSSPFLPVYAYLVSTPVTIRSGFDSPKNHRTVFSFTTELFLDIQHIRASFRLYCCGTGKSLTFGCCGISASFRLYCCGTASSGCIPESLPASLLSSYTVGQICIDPDISRYVSEKDFLVHRFVNNYTNCAGYDPSVQMRKLRRNGLCWGFFICAIGFTSKSPAHCLSFCATLQGTYLIRIHKQVPAHCLSFCATPPGTYLIRIIYSGCTSAFISCLSTLLSLLQSNIHLPLIYPQV